MSSVSLLSALHITSLSQALYANWWKSGDANAMESSMCSCVGSIIFTRSGLVTHRHTHIDKHTHTHPHTDQCWGWRKKEEMSLLILIKFAIQWRWADQSVVGLVPPLTFFLLVKWPSLAVCGASDKEGKRLRGVREERPWHYTHS